MLPSFRFDCVLRFSGMRLLGLIRFEPHHIRHYSDDRVFVILKWRICKRASNITYLVIAYYSLFVNIYANLIPFCFGSLTNSTCSILCVLWVLLLKQCVQAPQSLSHKQFLSHKQCCSLMLGQTTSSSMLLIVSPLETFGKYTHKLPQWKSTKSELSQKILSTLHRINFAYTSWPITALLVRKYEL